MLLFLQNPNANTDNPAVDMIDSHLCPTGSFSISPVYTGPVLQIDILALFQSGSPTMQAEHEYIFELRVHKALFLSSTPVQRIVQVDTVAAPLTVIKLVLFIQVR